MHGFLVTNVRSLFLCCLASVGDCAEKALGIEIYNCFAYRRMRVRSCVCWERIRYVCLEKKVGIRSHTVSLVWLDSFLNNNNNNNNIRNRCIGMDVA